MCGFHPSGPSSVRDRMIPRSFHSAERTDVTSVNMGTPWYVVPSDGKGRGMVNEALDMVNPHADHFRSPRISVQTNSCHQLPRSPRGIRSSTSGTENIVYNPNAVYENMCKEYGN